MTGGKNGGFILSSGFYKGSTIPGNSVMFFLKVLEHLFEVLITVGANTSQMSPLKTMNTRHIKGSFYIL